MEVYALVGESGTGKSHKAMLIAHENDIPLIIDDGLLIWKNKILAGKSSKRERNKVSAIRTAIFIEDEHAREVMDAIKFSKEEKILILGTSTRMVKKIIERLNLPGIKKNININEISNSQEINKAQYFRNKQGKHVIPVPIIEVKPKFSGYLLESFKLLLNSNSDTKQIDAETTVVRPHFGYYGRLIIYKKVLYDLIRHAIYYNNDDVILKKIAIEEYEEGIVINLKIILDYGIFIPVKAQKLQDIVINEIEKITGIRVIKLNIEVISLKVK
jgi:hypothetical protein